MSKRIINGTDLMNMIFSGAQILHSQVNLINSLNVFPVPDGDTGTNMSMTINSGIEQLNKQPSTEVGQVAEVFARGLLLGARGNSGVIMSQLFHGFAKALNGLEEANSEQLAAAFQQGVAVAYEAVVKPVEGTILTVSREAAQRGAMVATQTDDITELMKGILQQSKETLSKTPELLPVLKQAGVVDSGGQGLVCLYEGFCTVLEHDNIITPVVTVDGGGDVVAPQSAQAHFESEDIKYPYDMEFLIYLDDKKGKGSSFQVEPFRKKLSKMGDSVLVIQNEGIVKVHVHSDEPGSVLNLAIRHGELGQFHIENMRDQHRAIVSDGRGQAGGASVVTSSADASHVGDTSDASAQASEQKPIGVVAISIGEGLSDIFMSLGVDHILTGGQTMNPSTEDIIAAVQAVPAETVFVLPNNSNIILAANQAQQLAEKNVVVIPTKSIPQGIAAMFAFRGEAAVEANVEAMNEAIGEVKAGLITYAVRDSTFNELKITENDFIGVQNGEIVASDRDALTVGKQLLAAMISDSDEILTIFVGQDAVAKHTNALIAFVNEQYPDLEVETHRGGQPLYHYIFSVE